MRGLLVVNPKATTTSPRVIDVLVHAMSDEIELDVTVTTHKGHAILLGELAVEEGLDVVITLGGDGVVNEVVNGMLVRGPGPHVPLLATVPGGSANVFARTLGIPTDPVEATGTLLDLLRRRTERTIGLGRAGDRWFVANAGIGVDAEIIASMERKRHAGKAATPARYLATTISEVLTRTDRRHPALTLTVPPTPAAPNGADVPGIFLVIVQNSAPWTFLGGLPVSPSPEASFDAGLDVFALRRMRLPTALVAGQRILRSRAGGDLGGRLSQWHDLPGFTVTTARPVPMQIDGEAIGAVTQVVFRSWPDALRVVA